MEVHAVAWLVGRGHLPHSGLEVGDVGFGQADQLGDWVGRHGGIVQVGGQPAYPRTGRGGAAFNPTALATTLISRQVVLL